MSDPYLGEIRLFAGNYAPVGWHLCDGTALSIAGNDALFMLLGTTYGGDGINTFALPDLRGRVPIGMGQGHGLSPRVLGESFGSETVTLTAQQIPGHSHPFHAVAAPATASSPANALFANIGANDKLYIDTPPNPAIQALASKTVTSAGGSQPHNNIMRSVGMNYIICLDGIFPPHD